MTIARLKWLLCLTMTIAGCGAPPGLPEPRRVGVDAADLPQPPAVVRGSVTDVPYSEIGLQRSGCFGTCPVYSVVFHRDGAVSYVGEEHVDYIGRRTGRLSEGDFAELARFLDRLGFSTLDDWYRVRGTDMPTTTVTVTHVDGRTQFVGEYGPSGPPALWAIHRVITGLLTEVQWQ